MLTPVAARIGGVPEITVIIPTYNRKAWLGEAVDSVLSETRVPLIVRIFDNASTDGTEEYVRSLVRSDKRVHYSRHKWNLGSLRNYDCAFGAIDSNFFVPLADDDLLLPNFLYEAYQIMQRAPDLGAVIFQTEHRAVDGTVSAVNPSPGRASGRLEAPQHLADWMSNGHYQWSSILWNREVLDSIGAPNLKIGLPNDVDFQAQAFCRFPVVRVARPGAVYRMHSAQEHVGVLSGDWAFITRRLDAAVQSSRVLPWDKYVPLRANMLDNWKRIWHWMLARQGWDATVKAAWNLGFRVGDPAFGCTLLWRKMSDEPILGKVRARAAVRTRLRKLLRGDSPIQAPRSIE